MELSGYPKIYNLGHPLIADLFDGPVVIQEKVDGSQFSFGIDGQGNPFCRSKSAVVDMANPGMFALAVKTVQEIAGLCVPGYVYRAEFLQKPKHNTLAYDRAPRANLILFDVMVDVETYGDPALLEREAARLGLECVPYLGGTARTAEDLKALLDRLSILGGAKVEGVVIKNYGRFGLDGKPLMGKFVSEAFKEVHRGEWRKANPLSSDIIERLVASYRTPARWMKALQHLTEAGRITHSPQDIGLLIREAQADLEVECREEILAELLKWALPKVMRGATGGLPEWYKGLLMERQFEGSGNGEAQEVGEGGGGSGAQLELFADGAVGAAGDGGK